MRITMTGAVLSAMCVAATALTGCAGGGREYVATTSLSNLVTITVMGDKVTFLDEWCNQESPEEFKASGDLDSAETMITWMEVEQFGTNSPLFDVGDTSEFSTTASKDSILLDGDTYFNTSSENGKMVIEAHETHCSSL